MATISNERHLRYILLLGEGGTLVLKEVLNREKQRSGKTLDMLLEPNKATLKRKLDKQIFQKVFPANGIPDASTWDISLLATVILQLFRKHLTSDECSEIRNLKDLRNDLAHASSLSMDENEYDDDRKELAAALIKLSAGLDRTVHDKCQNFIKEFAAGPIDIHAATDRVKEFSKYDEMIRAELGSLTGKVEFMSQELQEVKQMLRKMMWQDEDFHSFQVFGTKMALRGPNDHLTVLAEESIIRLFRSALKRTGGDEDTIKLAGAVRAILSEIENCNGVEVLDVEQECIWITLKCNNCRGLLELLEYLESKLFQQRLQELSIALEETYNGSFNISAEITDTTLTDLMSFLQKNAERKSHIGEDQQSESFERSIKPKSMHTYTTEKELPTRILVSRIPSNVHVDYLEFFFENTKKYGGGPVLDISLNEEASTAVVEFVSHEAVNIVLSKQNIEMMGQAVKVEVYKPEPACTIEVRGSASLVCEENIELLQLYFEHPKSKGGTVKKIMFDRTRNSALVTFETEEVARRVVHSVEHVLKNQLLQTKLLEIESLDPSKHIAKKWQTVRLRNVKNIGSKDTIQRYFEDERKSEGGVIEDIRYSENEDDVVYITFESEEAAKRVTQREHIINDVSVDVSIHKCHPQDAFYGNRLLFKGVKTCTTEECLCYFLEAKTGIKPTRLAYHRDSDNIVLVEMESRPDVRKLTEVCQACDVNGAYLEVSAVPVSDCILVTNLPDDVSPLTVELYFENTRRSGGGDVRKVEMVGNSSALVYFEDYETVENIILRTHKLGEKTLKVHLFHDCVKLTEEDAFGIFVPDSITISDIDVRILQFIQESRPYKLLMKQKLLLCHAELEQIKEDGVQLKCTLSSKDLKSNKVVRKWASETKDAFQKLIDAIAIRSLQENLELVKAICSKLGRTEQNIIYFTDLSTCTVTIIGDIKTVESVSSLIQLMSEETGYSKVVEQVRMFSKTEMKMLQLLNYTKQVKQQYPNVEVSVAETENVVTLKGRMSEVAKAKLCLFEMKNSFSCLIITKLALNEANLYEMKETTEYIDHKLRAENISTVAWNVHHLNLIVCCPLENDTDKCIEIIKSSVVRNSVSLQGLQKKTVESQSMTQKVHEWNEMYPGKCSIEVKERECVEIFSTADIAQRLLTSVEEIVKAEKQAEKELSDGKGDIYLASEDYESTGWKHIEKKTETEREEIRIVEPSEESALESDRSVAFSERLPRTALKSIGGADAKSAALAKKQEIKQKPRSTTLEFKDLYGKTSGASGAVSESNYGSERNAGSPNENITSGIIYTRRRVPVSDRELAEGSMIAMAFPEIPDGFDNEGEQNSKNETEFNTITDEDEVEAEDKDIEMREYQKELAKEGSEGENVIVMAPTNTGKTRVACRIMQVHLRRHKQSEKIGKVIFLVENEALAFQQGKVCAELLPAYRTKVVSGSAQRDKKQYLRDFIDRRDILVVTAQVLLNALKQKDVDSITKFSMIVFDECHHTDNYHRFNEIMSRYMDLKLREHFDADKLPQIVGLTASLGVGGNTKHDAAIGHMKSLLANLDAKFLCTVRKNKEELRQYENNPIEETVVAKKRLNDRYRNAVLDIMDIIDEYMLAHPSMQTLQRHDEFIKEECRVPASRGTEQFLQWLSGFKEALGKLRSDTVRRMMNPCRIHLEMYNKALLIHADARIKDAEEILEPFMEMEKEINPKNDTDNFLLELYNDLKRKNFNDEPVNPKLLKMEEIVMRIFDNNADARGIIFVKTRELSQALVNWMRETEPLNTLNASEFVGQAASKAEGGMTKCGQKDVLEYFKGGRHKIIIATSVAEEGLDITKCNLVIRYEHVTNEIVRLQSRGRARMQDSRYYVLTEEGSWIVAKEEKNALLEKVMNIIVPELQVYIEDHPNIWERELQNLQEEQKRLEELKDEQRQANMNNDEQEFRCLNCNHFICFLSDIRKIQGAHHVVVDAEVSQRLISFRNPHPRFIDDELKFDGAIFCGNHDCQRELGGVCEYKHAEFPLLKIKNFRVVSRNGVGNTFKKWKKANFEVEPFTLEDLRHVVERRRADM